MTGAESWGKSLAYPPSEVISKVGIPPQPGQIFPSLNLGELEGDARYRRKFVAPLCELSYGELANYRVPVFFELQTLCGIWIGNLHHGLVDLVHFEDTFRETLASQHARTQPLHFQFYKYERASRENKFL